MGSTSPKSFDDSLHFEQLKANPYRAFSKAAFYTDKSISFHPLLIQGGEKDLLLAESLSDSFEKVLYYRVLFCVLPFCKITFCPTLSGALQKKKHIYYSWIL